MNKFQINYSQHPIMVSEDFKTAKKLYLLGDFKKAEILEIAKEYCEWHYTKQKELHKSGVLKRKPRKINYTKVI